MLIKDLPFFRWLEKHAEDFSAGFTNTNLELWKKLACKNVEIKSGIFQLDEREQSGQRERLNFGHTIAHALEKASNYKLLHGLAVGLGMIVEAEISVKLGIARPKDAERLRALVKNYGLPVRIPHQLKVEDIITHTKHDKKSRHGEARYVLLAKLGQVGQIASDQGFVEDAIVRQVILNNQA